MRFDRLELRNFKPYGDASLELPDGVTVIHGLNGSGKSSLLQACFFALYGARALDGTLDDVITNGEEESDIDLWFTHAGTQYHISRQLREYDNRTDHDCTLEGPDTTRDGVRDTRQFVTDLLRMDANAFVNCAYVRQGEVNKLINATATERQAMIDELLQLGKLEEYRERAGQARLGVDDILENRRGALETLEEQIDAKEQRGLYDRLNEFQSQLSTVSDEIANYEQQREAAVETREEADEILETYREKRAELDDLTTEIQDAETTIREVEAERESLAEQIETARDSVATLTDEMRDRLDPAGLESADESAIDARRSGLDTREEQLREEVSELRVDLEGYRNQAENLTDRADDFASQAEQAAEQATEFTAEADTAAAEVKEHVESREQLEDEADQLGQLFGDTAEGVSVSRGEATPRKEELRQTRSEIREEIAGIESDLENARQRVTEAERLLEMGKCPECGQDVEESPHTDQLEEDRARVDSLETALEESRSEREEVTAQLEAIEDLVEAEDRLGEIDDARELLDERISDRKTTAQQARERAAELQERVTELREQETEAREAAAAKREEAEESAGRVESLEDDLVAVETARGRVDAVAERLERVAELEDTIERLRDNRESLAEQNDLRKEQLAEKRETRDDLRAAVDDDQIEKARSSRKQAVSYIEDVDDELEKLGSRRDELQSAVGGVEQDIDALEQLQDDRESLFERVSALESLKQEASQLETTYSDLRTELRRQNVSSLERTLNEVFELIYVNDAYSHIELDNQYELTVYQKDGQPLDPEQLSGGERALFNLSLRCGIYRLLAEGIEGAAPTPPLILDEPTVFLDSGHVARLVTLVEEMRGFGVGQVIIVSHDEELVSAADGLLSVEKNPTTNRSTVTKSQTPTVADVTSDD